MRFIVAFAFLILGASALAQEKILPPPPAPKIVPPHPTVKDVERDLKRKRKKRKENPPLQKPEPPTIKEKFEKNPVDFSKVTIRNQTTLFYPSIQTTGNFRTDYGELSLSYKLEFRLGDPKTYQETSFWYGLGCRPSISLEPIEIQCRNFLLWTKFYLSVDNA